MAVPHVILDGNSLPSDDSEDDSEDRIVEAAVLDGDLPFGHVEGPSIGGFSKQPGKLVEQILSAQREFVDTDVSFGLQLMPRLLPITAIVF